MREEASPDGEESPKERRAAEHPLDARGAQGLQIGDHGRQVNYFTQVVAGKVQHAPRVTIHGQIDSPYLGLKAFGQDDAAFFFGREAAAQEILNRLAMRLDRPQPLVVSGPSGAGKSSLLQAGVLPRLGEAGLASGSDAPPWRSAVVVPARAPLNELAVAAASLTGTLPANLVRSLREDPAGFALTVRAIMRQNDSGPDKPQRLLLVVDQFEQVFTQCADDAERQAFIAAISAVATTGFGQGHTPAALVVLAVRSDFEAQCAAYEELADAVQNRYLLTPMTEQQLRTVITRPAGIAKATVEPALVEELLRVVRGPSSAGVLPHLSHALDQAWRERADDDMITLADYEQVGGIEGSISASAERAFGQLTDAEQTSAQPVFMRLITTSSDLVVSAGRATRDELMAGAAGDDVSAILEAFAAERLLTLGEDSIEISHEALLTAWERLRSWLDGDKIDMARYSRLNTDAREWAAHQRQAAYLYPPGRLAEVDAAARRWAGIPGRYPALASGARAFLDESRKAARRTRRIRRAVIVVLTALTVAAATTAALATHYASTASQQQSIALSRALAAQVLALESSDPAGAGQLAVAAWHAAPTSQAASAMTAVLLRQGDGGIPVANGFSHSVALSPDGSLLATVSEDTSVQLWSTATGKPVWQPMYLGDVSAVAFSPDGKILATMDDKHVRLLTPATGRVVQTFTLSRDPGVPNPSLSSMTFSPDGKLVAAGDDGYIRLWNTATGKLIRKPWRAAFSDVVDVAFSPDGKLIASVGDTKAGDYPIELWDVATGRQVDGDLPGDTGQVSESSGSIGFSPDGKFLALATRNGVQLWRLEAGRPMLAEAIEGDGDGLAFGRRTPSLPLAVMVACSSGIWSTVRKLAPYGQTIRTIQPCKTSPST